MGPTIGSTDRRAAIALGGLGVLTRTQSTVQNAVPMTSLLTGMHKVGRVTGVTTTPGLVDTNYIDTTTDSGENLVDETVIEPESSGVPTWVWVVGGIAGLGLIGGLAWWALK